MEREGALWMGDLAEYMDENFLLAAFKSLGEDSVLNVKVMKNRFTGNSAGYCFVNFSSDQAGLTAMHKLNGKIIPNSQPPVRFKLNHSSSRSGSEKEFSLWVGDLTLDVDDYSLYRTFASRYATIRTAKVIYNQSGLSKGFAFVRFCSEEECKDALVNMNGFKGLGQKPLKVSYAVPKKTFYGNNMGSGGDYNQYYEQYWQNYAAWQNYGSYYDGTGGTYDSYNYSAQGSNQSGDNQGSSQDDLKDEMELVDYNQPPDIEKMNEDLMQKNEEFWASLEKSRWTFWDELHLQA